MTRYCSFTATRQLPPQPHLSCVSAPAPPTGGTKVVFLSRQVGVTQRPRPDETFDLYTGSKQPGRVSSSTPPREGREAREAMSHTLRERETVGCVQKTRTRFDLGGGGCVRRSACCLFCRHAAAFKWLLEPQATRSMRTWWLQRGQTNKQTNKHLWDHTVQEPLLNCT